MRGFACSAFTDHITLALAAKQLCCQQIFVFGFVFCRSFFICRHTLLHPIEQIFRNDCRNAARLDNIIILVFADIFAVMQHSGDAVNADFTATFSANTFQIHFIGNFAHRRPVCIMLKCVKHRRSRQGINLKILLTVNDISDRQCAAVVLTFQRVFGQSP